MEATRRVKLSDKIKDMNQGLAVIASSSGSEFIRTDEKLAGY